MSHVFYPHSISFVSKSAKQLRRAFPGLNPNAAHEAVACALGFAHWFDCRSRIEAGGFTPSAPDEDVSQEARIARRYQQVIGIVDATQLPIADVEGFVRCWSLTAQAPGELEQFVTGYEALRADGEAAAANGAPDWQVPEQLADGVLLGYDDSSGTQYIELSVKRLLAVPIWMRGNAGGFLASECFLYPALPGVFSTKAQEQQLEYLRFHNHHLHYWATGEYPEPFRGERIPSMLKQAERDPTGWYALAVRCDMTGHEPPDPWPQFAPALRGKQFASFLRNKGALRLRDVQWFRVSRSEAGRLGDSFFGSLDERATTVRLDERECEPSAPLYASPFKHGAMHDHEWNFGLEGGAYPIAHDLDDDDDDDGADEGSNGPLGPSVVQPPLATA